jgi:precorrin-6B methylase 2
MTRRQWILACLSLPAAFAQEKKLRDPDVIFVPTPRNVIDEMLKLANVHKGDVLYDLGCGDGRTVIAAAQVPGVRAVGVDINPERIKESMENARQAGVTNATFRNEDLFETDIHDASVVFLYLLPSLNLKLRPKLWRELKPGTRIVSHAFDMGDWKPEKEVRVDSRTLYFWTIPAPSAQPASQP